MTVNDSVTKFKKAPSHLGSSLYSLFALSLLCLITALLSDAAAEGAREGLMLSLKIVVPSALPFMILSELYTTYGSPQELKPLGIAFEKITGISRSGCSAFILGGLCGFPIGVKVTADIYRKGELQKGCAERLMAISNNPSPAFILGAVGHGMLSSRRSGYILLLSVFLSALLLGAIGRRKTDFSKNNSYISGQSYDFVASVKGAANGCLYITAFISLFSAIKNTVKVALGNSVAGAIGIILEVTGACSYLSSLPLPSQLLRHGLLAFALGFGGLSVFMQSAVFVKDTDLSLLRFLLYKVLHGVLSFLICIILFRLVDFLPS